MAIHPELIFVSAIDSQVYIIKLFWIKEQVLWQWGLFPYLMATYFLLLILNKCIGCNEMYIAVFLCIISDVWMAGQEDGGDEIRRGFRGWSSKRYITS